MRTIQVLDQNTIDKIAAGEVVERPASVVKELVENAIDANATAITVEIKEGGLTFIRITDNGGGIEKEQVPLAFLRHATSKIEKVEDLLHIVSLGFRGEALSSIAAVSKVELITKTPRELTGIRYLMEGGIEKSIEEIGAPSGTTFLIRNLFYNVPARSKFLKTATTEAGYISNFMEQLALSHASISFKYIVNGQTKLHTSGNGNRKDVIYGIYGREITKDLLEVHYKSELLQMDGFVGKPSISRGNRNFENYYVNGRYVKSKIITKAAEDAYQHFLMQHKYPFTVLDITMDGTQLDINVHPTKMEVRFLSPTLVYDSIFEGISQVFSQKELIPEVSFLSKKTEETEERKEEVKAEVKVKEVLSIPEPFEEKRREFIRENTVYPLPDVKKEPDIPSKQLDLFEEKLLSPKARKHHRMIGQLFATYWLVEYEDKFYMIDQHAAHEKVLYERIMKELKTKNVTSQFLSPPMIVALNLQQEQQLLQHMDIFTSFGFQIEHFGGREYSIHAVPDNLYGITKENLFIELLDNLDHDTSKRPLELITHRLATVACKKAVKGNQTLSYAEADRLIDELLTLENPYHCPHGRPTIIAMTKQEIEKKFKRIV